MCVLVDPDIGLELGATPGNGGMMCPGKNVGDATERRNLSFGIGTTRKNGEELYM